MEKKKLYLKTRKCIFKRIDYTRLQLIDCSKTKNL